MPISRRKFLGTGTLAVLSAAVPLKAAAEALDRSGLSPDAFSSTPNSAKTSSLLNQQAFSNCLGSEFRISDQNGGRIRTKLIEVYDWNPKLTKGSKALVSKRKFPKECFSAVFLAPPGARLLQHTYKVEHSTLGEFSLFLVPAGRSRQGTYYEAVFNNLR
jgi:uncharacterized protein DUF6916